MKHNKKYGRHLVSSVFGFLLTLIFVVLFLCGGVGYGLLSDRSIIQSLKQSDYYNKVYIELMDRSGDIMEHSGHPRTVLEDVITLDKVYIAGKNYMNAAFIGREAVINTVNLKLMLIDKINQYRRNQGITDNDMPFENIEEMVSIIEQDYMDVIELPFLYRMKEYRENYISLLIYLIPSLIILALVIGYLLLKMHRYLYRGLRYIAYAMISASLLIWMGAFYIRNTGINTRVMVEPDYYQHFIDIYLKWSVTVILYVGGLGMIFSLVLILLIGFIKNQVESF